MDDLIACLCIFVAVSNGIEQKTKPAPQMFIVEQARPDPNPNIQNPKLNVISAVAILHQQCSSNFTCANLPNVYCSSNATCECLPNFVEDTIFVGTCRLAPGYNEMCAVGQIECRNPFVCNSSSLCDCPVGFIQEYFQCIKDCPSGQIPIDDKCFPARQLNDKCQRNEQCVQAYSQCSNKKCQCIPGSTQTNGQCAAAIQCPVGSIHKDKRGNPSTCGRKNQTSNDECPVDHYCMQAEPAFKSGVCCPKMKMNCPIGQPQDDHDCNNCTWETHHCFSYVIGGFTETMCCPNACPTSHPIQKAGKCHARSAFGGHCEVDEQCYNVLGAMCQLDTAANTTTCQCPEGNYKYYFGRCLRDSALGEKCASNDECKQGTNTKCTNGVCTCFDNFIPDPSKRPGGETPQFCIAEPSCPSIHGLKSVKQYAECSEDASICKHDQFCRQWWFGVNFTHALCCPKPTLETYKNICKPFGMTVHLDGTGKNVRRCDIQQFPQIIVANDALNETTSDVKYCPVGVSCLFDPFEVNKGICCQPEHPVEVPTEAPAVPQPAVQAVQQPEVPAVHQPEVVPAVQQPEVPVVNPLEPEPEIFEEEQTSSAATSTNSSPTTRAPVKATKTPATHKPQANTNIPVIRVKSKSKIN